MNKSAQMRWPDSYSDNQKPVLSNAENRKSKIGGGMKRFVGLLAIFVTLAACGAAARRSS